MEKLIGENGMWRMDCVCSGKVANVQVINGQRERVYSLETSREVAT